MKVFNCDEVPFLFFFLFLVAWCQNYKIQIIFYGGTRYTLKNTDLVADGP